MAADSAVVQLLDKFSIIAGILSFIIMTIAFRILAIHVYDNSERFKNLSRVFDALAVMCGVFIFTAAMLPSFPEYAWVWRLIGRPPIFGVAFELCRFLWKVYREENGKP